MLKSLFPWKPRHKTKVKPTMEENELILQEPTLQACRICGRTFVPISLKRHERVCERQATKKRKPFDSLRQRVEGTDLAPFHQRTYIKKPPENNPKQINWQERHLELVTAIRAAKGVAAPADTPTRPKATPTKNKTTPTLRGATPTERCPSCDRQFGPKAFDRHVEWCRERKTRLHPPPSEVLLAKERLEARTKYKVPPLGKSKRTIVREKYSCLELTKSPEGSVKNSPLSRGPSVRKPKSLINVGGTSSTNESAARAERGKGGRGEEQRAVPVIGSPKAGSVKSPSPSNYDPFESAQRQFMELLECDDFKPFTPSPVTPTFSPFVPKQRTPSPTVAKRRTPSPPVAKQRAVSPTNGKRGSAPSSRTPANVNSGDAREAGTKRGSVIEPPITFKDSLDSVNDDFEALENLINGECNRNNISSGFYLNLSKDSAKRKYSDDMSSIDPNLINENDNLSLPETFKSDDYSPTSVDTEVTIQNMSRSVDQYSVEYDKKIEAIEPKVEKKPLLKRALSLKKESTLKNAPKKLSQSSKVSSRSVSSFPKSESVEKKKNLPSLKRSMTLFDPSPKPPSLKNKQEVDSYLEKGLKKDSKKKETAINAEDLFAVDDAMYEEYKKYEEMYLKEKEGENKPKSTKKHKNFELNYGILTASEEETDQHSQIINKLSNDSAYGSQLDKTVSRTLFSLTRKTPKHRARTTKLSALEQKRVESTSSSGSENGLTSPSPVGMSQKLSKFCHECGTKFPVSSAKFCVECGVRRLVL